MERRERKYFLIRINDGAGSHYERDAFDKEYAAVGYFGTEIGLHMDMSKKAIVETYRQKQPEKFKGRTPGGWEDVAGYWLAFVKLIPGDVLLMKLSDGTGMTAVGKVTGEAKGFQRESLPEERDAKCDFRWWIGADWCKEVECLKRDDLVGLGGQQTIRELKPNEHELTVRSIEKHLVGPLERFNLRKFPEHEPMETKWLEEKRALLEEQGQIVLSGPPGTGKTYGAQRLTSYLFFGAPDGPLENLRLGGGHDGCKGAWGIVQFHPSYNYEDFVRGIRVTTIGQEDSRPSDAERDGAAPSGRPDAPGPEHSRGGVVYETIDRTFAKMCWLAAIYGDFDREGNEWARTGTKFVLIIDEINRANLAATLGELIYGLEYRGEPITLPYDLDKRWDINEEREKGGLPRIEKWEDLQKSQIVVPPNLLVIGTMNTADRSVGHIDYAVRRRFAFVNCLPDATQLSGYYQKTKAEPGTEEKALELFAAVSLLFTDEERGVPKFRSPEFHASDVQVGHTYFMAQTMEELVSKFVYQVYPILREYYKDGVLRKPTTEKDGLKIPGLGIRIDEELSAKDLQGILDGSAPGTEPATQSDPRAMDSEVEQGGQAEDEPEGDG